MEEEFKFGRTAADTTDSGRKAWLMAEVDWCTLMEMFTMVNGRKTKHMDMVPNKTTTEVDTKDNGSTTNSMVKEKKLGQMDLLTSENTPRE